MHLDLIVADHLDTLSSGKHVAVGLFPDRVIVLNAPSDAPSPTPEVPFGHPLSLLLTLTELPVQPTDGTVTITPPGRAAGATMPLSGVHCPPGRSVSILIRLEPLLVPQAGQFEVKVVVGDKSASQTFEVRIRNAYEGKSPPWLDASAKSLEGVGAVTRARRTPSRKTPTKAPLPEKKTRRKRSA